MVVYLIGYKNGAIQSVAVVSKDSKTRPPALFMAPAAQLVLKLIQSGSAIGGTGRLDAGFGDLYLAYTARGTTAITRPTKDGVYTAVPPAVVDEWFADMTLRNEWLWPVKESSDPTTGDQRFRFDEPDGRPTGLSVEYDSSDEEGLIPAATGTVSHIADGRLISVAQLERLGATVDPTLPGIP